MTPIILLAFLFDPMIGVEVREIQVDLLETNIVTQEDGTVRFTQIVAWDKGSDDNNRPCAIDRGYKVVKENYPLVHPYEDGLRVVWWSGTDKCYVLTAKEHLITTTDYDREAKFREYGGIFRPCW